MHTLVPRLCCFGAIQDEAGKQTHGRQNKRNEWWLAQRVPRVGSCLALAFGEDVQQVAEERHQVGTTTRRGRQRLVVLLLIIALLLRYIMPMSPKSKRLPMP